MSIAALVLSLLGLIFFFIPFLGLVLSIVAFILSIVGIVKKKKIGFAISGLIISIIGLIMGLIISSGALLLVSSASNSMLAL